MRTTQAHVKVHDAMARMHGVKLPEVRYDLVESTAAAFNSDSELPAWHAKLVELGRVWLARRFPFPGTSWVEVREIEHKIDQAVVERLENGVATTCGGIL